MGLEPGSEVSGLTVARFQNKVVKFYFLERKDPDHTTLEVSKKLTVLFIGCV